ncbi:4-hydroxy-3-methylbut-2-enyl diphosphate reductase [Streptomyces sp. V4I8]|uniref:4-hydroxy-3-methylbut-2-enyl diphosphate reductase n=1 Tax=Streptomyces sp. V4I8 TaxID=3156469 RepID=UPI0035195EE6
MNPSPTRRRILLAAPRGACAGVNRAIAAVEKALELYGAPVYVRHEIVHNKYVVQTLEKKGAIFVEQTQEVPPGNIVMFSAHGVAPVVHEEAERGKLATIDATCPLVTKVHKEAVRFAKEDYDILLIGHEGHEEVIGTSGEAPDHIQLVDGPKDVTGVEVRDPSKVVWLSQTTLSVDETVETVDALKEKFPQLISPPSDDICYATQNRQLAVKQMGAEAELVIVVGSRNSSNSKRLVEVAKLAGSREAYLVDFADEIDEAWLQGVTTVGVTSGASVPEVLVEQVLEWLAQRGYDDVELVKAAEESIIFSLPKELRRNLREEAAALGAGRESSTSSSPDTDHLPAFADCRIASEANA